MGDNSSGEKVVQRSSLGHQHHVCSVFLPIFVICQTGELVTSPSFPDHFLLPFYMLASMAWDGLSAGWGLVWVEAEDNSGMDWKVFWALETPTDKISQRSFYVLDQSHILENRRLRGEKWKERNGRSCRNHWGGGCVLKVPTILRAKLFLDCSFEIA